jgi:hypothetical protein
MNYKKGLIRLLILGVALSLVIGFGRAFDDMKDIRIGMDSLSAAARMSSKDSECVKSIRENTVYIGAYHQASMNCNLLKSYWRDLEKYQGDQPDFDGIRIAISNKSVIRQMQTWLLEAANTFILYIALCILAVGIFSTYKWIIKGFKSQ